MKRLLLLMLLTTTTHPDLVFHLGIHSPMNAAILHAGHNAVPNNGSLSLKLTSDECADIAMCSLAAIALTAAAYCTIAYLAAPQENKK